MKIRALTGLPTGLGKLSALVTVGGNASTTKALPQTEKGYVWEETFHFNVFNLYATDLDCKVVKHRKYARSSGPLSARDQKNQVVQLTIPLSMLDLNSTLEDRYMTSNDNPEQDISGLLNCVLHLSRVEEQG